MKILYVGPLFAGSTALHRMRALKQLGCEVTPINIELPFGYRSPKWDPRWLIKRLMKRTDIWVDWKRVHRKLHNAAKSASWDLLWVDKGTRIRPEALRAFKARQPGCCLVNYSPDDMFNPANQTARYRAAFRLYDLFVTTKSYNVAELKAAGARDVFFVDNAYEPAIHRPMALSETECRDWACDVCFVGAFEPDREESIRKLAETGVSIGLFGPWRHLADRYKNVACHEEFFADDAYAKALCAGKIGLGFLRKANRDLQTTRSVELPACGVFMLAERTEEHLRLFQEGQEAEFFDSDDEMIEKVDKYLKDEVSRRTVAAAGLRRCLDSDYSNAGRLGEVFGYISQMQSAKDS